MIYQDNFCQLNFQKTCLHTLYWILWSWQLVASVFCNTLGKCVFWCKNYDFKIKFHKNIYVSEKKVNNRKLCRQSNTFLWVFKNHSCRTLRWNRSSVPKAIQKTAEHQSCMYSLCVMRNNSSDSQMPLQKAMKCAHYPVVDSFSWSVSQRHERTYF